MHSFTESKDECLCRKAGPSLHARRLSRLPQSHCRDMQVGGSLYSTDSSKVQVTTKARVLDQYSFFTDLDLNTVFKLMQEF